MQEDPYLTPEEFNSLKEVARGGPLRKRIPDDHRRKLRKLRYIVLKLGGDVATREGHIRVAKEE